MTVSGPEIDLAPAFSGFCYNPRLLFAPGYYAPLALQKLMPFMTHGWSHRWYSAPPDPRVAIGAGLTLRTQLRIIPGSRIVGWRFCTLGGAAVSDFKFHITDSDTQQSFTQGNSRFLNCNSLVPNGATGLPFCLFPTPYEVVGGVVSIALSNTNTTTAQKCQMLLYVLEPAQSPTEAASGSVMVPFPSTDEPQPHYRRYQRGGKRQ